MKKELQDNLIRNYPKLYRKEDKRECFSLFGFECDDGWYDLLVELSEKIYPLLVNDEMYVAQVKEKFGTLRFYMNTSTDEIEQYIRKAEEKSEITCEVCGKYATLQTKNRWLYTACEEHLR